MLHAHCLIIAESVTDEEVNDHDGLFSKRPLGFKIRSPFGRRILGRASALRQRLFCPPQRFHCRNELIHRLGEPKRNSRFSHRHGPWGRNNHFRADATRNEGTCAYDCPIANSQGLAGGANHHCAWTNACVASDDYITLPSGMRDNHGSNTQNRPFLNFHTFGMFALEIDIIPYPNILIDLYTS